ncbi:MAG: hypothetical protein COV10_02225 [Candidatus Vogelbacteria bacterium CG10_big_fil_rev_8_21_14_0_10_51_16]|uniref:Polymerase beta nucleotidyltransferase domain-containing protein n=1 Tax=Candidatus Vogelbacteria bacterium CG10_big_fil_rev_8_21_14_0_10_51_16 TaxID=1975045 RepID=A0A2H0REV0_9BACT|nr:MAG: hypothetical protein COV10_02225 [Candidatus Vogelbacteria bacterium CG10_big_fil_rev_8_21_14_0_10_51_16]
MRLEYYPVNTLKRELRELTMRHLDLSQYRLFFFGSRVEGKGTDRSDIDMGIEGPNPVPAESLQAIEEGVEALSTLYKIDVVDFGRVPERFKAVALQHQESF